MVVRGWAWMGTDISCLHLFVLFFLFGIMFAVIGDTGSIGYLAMASSCIDSWLPARMYMYNKIRPKYLTAMPFLLMQVCFIRSIC
jgi:hypothetical protein